MKSILLSDYIKRASRYRQCDLNGEFVCKIQIDGTETQFTTRRKLLNSFGLELDNFFPKDHSGKCSNEINSFILLLKRYRGKTVKGIIFDKDGTLLDFEAFWLPVTYGVLKDLARKFCVSAEAEKSVKQKIGIHDGKVGRNSVLCAGTYAQMSEIVRSVFSQFGTEAAEKEMYRELCRAFEENMFRGTVVPTTPNLRELLLYLKVQGIKLFVATTDNFSITSACLKKLGTEDLFDGVFTDGAGYPPKPDPYIIEKIVKEYAVPRENLLMVGDTCTDLQFACNGQIKAAAYISQENEGAVLSPSPDFLIRDLNELRSVDRFFA